MFRVLANVLIPKFIQRWMFDYKVKPVFISEFDFFENISRHLIRERKQAKDGGKHTDMLQLMVNAEHNVDELRRTFSEDLSNQADGHHVNAGV